MKKFINSLFLFFLILVLPTAALIAVFHKYIPGPKITNSYSLNEKNKFLQSKKDLQVDVLTLGSSIALNNAHSGVIMDLMNTTSYLNTAAWGLRISQMYDITKSLLSDYNPKKVILTANVVDFYPPEIQLDVKDISDFIRSNSTLKYQFRFFETDYFFRRLYTNRRNFSTNKIYMSLNFDDYGAVMFQKEGFVKNDERWKKLIHFKPIRQENYIYLDSLASMFSIKGVEFIYVQTPIREGMLSDEYSENIIIHIDKIKAILGKYPNTFFVDGTKKVWDDSLFVDTQHLNSVGAEVFSNYFLTEYLNLKNQ